MLIKGPFEMKVGPDYLAGIDTIKYTYAVAEDKVDTIQGRSYTIPKSHAVDVVITFAESDVASLAVVLPQYFVPNGGTLSTGETVNDAAGAIDIVPGDCGDVAALHDVILEGCGENSGVLRLPKCSSEIDGIDIKNSIRTVDVKFVGETSGATAQLFAKGAVTIAS